MKIGIDARFYSSAFTGIGCYVKELIEHITQLDGENQYVLFFNQPYFDEFVPPRKGVMKILANAPHYSFAEQWLFAKNLYDAKLDLMHFTHFNAPLLYRKKSIVTIHDLTLTFFPGKKMGNAFNQFVYRLVISSIARRSYGIISVSEHTKQDIVNLLHVPEQKIHVIHNGVAHRFHPIRNGEMIQKFLQQYGLRKPYILYTGVWRTHKNLLNLIRAFAILKNKHKFPGQLVISGKEDPWYPEVQETVRSEGLSGDVRFTGHVPDEDLVLLYNGALVYVLPSLYEGFGLSVLEAFACGVPVAASRASSIPEICGKDNAIFFDPRDPTDMAEKIAMLAFDEAKRHHFVERGINRAKEFSWEKTATSTLELYRAALGTL